MSIVLPYMIPFFYIIVLAFLLTRIRWLQQADFTKKFIVLFFVAKCLAGFAYNFVALYYIPNRGDIWPFFDDGVYLYRQFLTSPSAFYQIWSQGFGYTDLNALNTNSGLTRSAFEIIKSFHFLLSFFTFGSLAGNTVIFNFFTVLCFFYCWQFLKQQLGSQGIFAGLVFFLIPSMFFYSSGILKEGFVIAMLCIIIPIASSIIYKNSSVKKIAAFVAAILFLFALKFFVALLWLFCMAVWWLMAAFKRRQLVVLFGSVLVAACCFFYSYAIIPSVNFPRYLVQRQQEFLALPAASAMPVSVLTDQPVSFAKALPRALNNVLFKPLPGEGGKMLYLAFTAEMLLFWVGILFIFFTRKRHLLLAKNKRLVSVFLLFSLLNLLVIGLIIPNVGAMMRYRSIFFPFLALAAIIITNWQPFTSKAGSKLAKFICG